MDLIGAPIARGLALLAGHGSVLFATAQYASSDGDPNRIGAAAISALALFGLVLGYFALVFEKPAKRLFCEIVSAAVFLLVMVFWLIAMIKIPLHL